MLKPRCSSLDRVMACNGSVLPSDKPPEGGGPEAILGSAKHEALSSIPLGGNADLDEIAAKYGVDVGEIRIAMARGRSAWNDVGHYFPHAEVEAKLDCGVCSGRTDIISAPIDPATGAPETIRIGDWKTGWGNTEHPCQLKGYALAAVEEYGYPASGIVTVFEIHTALGETTTTNISTDDLEIFADKLADIITLADRAPDKLEYRAGSHCQYCPHRADCRTYGGYLRGSVTALAEVNGKAVTREVLADLYRKAEMAKKALAQYDKAVDLALADGPLELPDGYTLTKVMVERQKVDGSRAIPALIGAGIIDLEDSAELIGDIPKTRIDALAKRKARKGRKAGFLRAAYREIEDAGGLKTTHRWQRKCVRGDK